MSRDAGPAIIPESTDFRDPARIGSHRLAWEGRPFGCQTIRVTRGTRAKNGLTKADLIDVVYERHGALTRDEAAAIVDVIFSTVKTSLGDGRTVRIKNFGTFEVADRKGRLGINPANGEKMYIPPHRGLAFRPARRLRKVVGPRRPKTG